MNERMRSSAKKRSGQALIELTLLLPLILIIVGGVTDLGLAFYASIALQNAVREGARVAATDQDENRVRAEVSKRVPPAVTLQSVSLTGPFTEATCRDASGASVIQQAMEVTATARYTYMFLHLIGFTSADITRSARMRRERCGSADCPLCYTS